MSIKFLVEIAYSVYKDIEIVGWAIGKRPNTELSFQFCEEDGTVVNYVLRRYHRGDVGELKTNSTEENHYGFKLRFPFEISLMRRIMVSMGRVTAREIINAANRAMRATARVTRR